MPKLVQRLVVMLTTFVVGLIGLLVVGTAPAHAASGELYSLLNQSRSSAGLKGLVRDARLDKVAQDWNDKMASTGDMAHNPSMFQQIPPGWSVAGENVGYAGSDSSLHTAWMNSPGHRANILHREYSSVGIGWTRDANGRIWGTQVFAAYSGVTWVPPVSAPPTCPTQPAQTRSTPTSKGLGLVPLTPARLLDTRTSQVVNGGCQLAAGGRYDLQVTGRGWVPTSGVAAVMLNLTVVAPAKNTWLAAYPAGAAFGGTSSVNGLMGENTAASVLVPWARTGR